jgi:hypothetical protein
MSLWFLFVFVLWLLFDKFYIQCWSHTYEYSEMLMYVCMYVYVYM